MASQLIIKNHPNVEVTYPQAILNLGQEVADFYEDALIEVTWFKFPPYREYYVNAQGGDIFYGAVFCLDVRGIKCEWNDGIGYGATVEEAVKSAINASRTNRVKYEVHQLGKYV